MSAVQADWLSAEWVEATTAALGSHPGLAGEASGLVAVEVTGAGGGEYWRRWEDGVPLAGGAGKPADAPDLKLSLPVADAEAFWRGEWSPSVAYMRGELKTEGDTGLLLALLAAGARPSVIEVVRGAGGA